MEGPQFECMVKVGCKALAKALLENKLRLLTVDNTSESGSADALVRAVYLAMRETERTGGGNMQNLARQPRKTVFVPDPKQRTTLTEREKDVLFHMCLDKDNKRIARDLKVSPLTVKNHIQKILSVYKCRTRLGAAINAILIGDITTADLKEAYGRNNTTQR